MILIAIPLLLIFFLPVYLPLLAGFALRGPDWKEVRWCLRAATLISVLIIMSIPTKRNEFGDDVAGNLKGAGQHFPIIASAVWIGGTLSGVAGLVMGLRLRDKRREDSAAKVVEKPDTTPAP